MLMIMKRGPAGRRGWAGGDGLGVGDAKTLGARAGLAQVQAAARTFYTESQTTAIMP